MQRPTTKCYSNGMYLFQTPRLNAPSDVGFPNPVQWDSVAFSSTYARRHQFPKAVRCTSCRTRPGQVFAFARHIMYDSRRPASSENCLSPGTVQLFIKGPRSWTVFHIIADHLTLALLESRHGRSVVDSGWWTGKESTLRIASALHIPMCLA